MPEERLKSVREQLDDIENFHKWRWYIVLAWNIFLAIAFLVGTISFARNQDRLNNLAKDNRTLIRQNEHLALQAKQLAAQTRVLTVNHEHIFCGLKQNVVGRIKSSEKYLSDIRSGKRQPIPGITPADIAVGLARDRQALEDFERLKCGARGGG
jgi:hypothetical protein